MSKRFWIYFALCISTEIAYFIVSGNITFFQEEIFLRGLLFAVPAVLFWLLAMKEAAYDIILRMPDNLGECFSRPKNDNSNNNNRGVK